MRQLTPNSTLICSHCGNWVSHTDLSIQTQLALCLHYILYGNKHTLPVQAVGQFEKCFELLELALVATIQISLDNLLVDAWSCMI